MSKSNNMGGWMNTVSYPCMNLMLNILIREEAMKDPEAIKHMRNQQALRYWKIIFNDKPYQPVFG